ncbi:MAG: (2Fe-2S)-binding protein [Chloroflexi bacterium]|nr:(2Fe-2S)-binding protein [Chloroflexota bacterium]
MASITVDGQVIEAPAGAPLVEVLKNNGFYVSSLCYIDGLKPYAGCRSCLVDIEGPPGLQLSCTSVVQDGMKVTTSSDEVKDARKAVVSLILANHSDRCLTCHRREHCHPGDICLRDDVVTHRCLTCSKNYRCELQATCEMVGMSGYEPWVGEERSWYQHPQPPADRANPYMEFDPQMCIICTRCQRACEDKRHTGAITLSGKGWDTRIAFGAGGAIHESNCDFSGACIDVCPTAALMEHPNKWVAKPDTWTMTTCDSCAVGCSLKLGSKEGRGVIVRPGNANPFSGDQICVRGRYHYDSLKPRERLSRHFVRRGAIHAPASLADALAEAAQALKDAKSKGRVGVLVGGNLTNEEGWAAAKIAAALGGNADLSSGPVVRAVKGALEARLGTWRTAADMTRIPAAKALVVIADDLEESHNVASVRVKDAAVHQKAKVIVIGAVRSELVDFAACWLRSEPGEEGLTAARLADAVAGGQPHDHATAEAAGILRDAPRDGTLVVCAPNPVSAAIAGSMAGGAANLAVALFGNAASENLVVLPTEANVNGLLDVGVAASGGDDPLAGLAGLLVVRDDPTMRLPGAAEALAKIGTIVVIDNVLHETAKRAAVVIAEGRAYASRGTYTTGGFRIQKLSPAVAPEGDAIDCYRALHGLGAALGVDLPANADAALGEIAKANPAYQPAHDLILGEGVAMAVAASGKGTIVPVAALTVSGRGLRLATGRDLYTAADAAALRHPEAEKLHRYDRIQVSEADAARLGIHSGDEVEIAAGGAAIRAKADVNERVATGTVFVSSLLQGGAVAQFFTGDALPTVTLTAAAVPGRRATQLA